MSNPTKPGEPAKVLDGAFSPPPEGAPYEISQPLKAELLAIWQARAREHERPLPGTGTSTPSPSGGIISASNPGVPEVRRDPGDATGPLVPPPVRDPLAPGPGFRPRPDAPYQPAASNTDSPSRGIPSPTLDPGKQITGGWGESPAGTDYYALDGTELLALVQHLWQQLDRQLTLDLRFGMATCYPQVRARLTLEVTGATPDAPITDQQFQIQTRILTLAASRQDDPDTPAGQIREDLSLPQPYKHRVKNGPWTQFVDRED